LLIDQEDMQNIVLTTTKNRMTTTRIYNHV
jgi:hypothetical protein